jgi:hypothetical protein
VAADVEASTWIAEADGTLKSGGVDGSGGGLFWGWEAVKIERSGVHPGNWMLFKLRNIISNPGRPVAS